MIEVSLIFVLGVFAAGFLTFLAPCTFPLVPAFIGFISGVSAGDTEKFDVGIRKKLITNTLFYIFGFSIIFIFFGVLAGLAGTLLAPFRIWLARVGGLMVIIFGLYLLGVFKLNFFRGSASAKLNAKIKRRGPLASMAFGVAFGAGWSPCVGPILGTVLLLTSSEGSIVTGVIMLTVFSIGLGVPFLLTAIFLGQASRVFEKLGKHIEWLNKFAGVLVVFLGVLLITNNLDLLVGWGFRALEFLNYEERLLNYL